MTEADLGPFFQKTDRFGLSFSREIILGAILGAFVKELCVNLWPWPQKSARRWGIGKLAFHSNTAYRGGPSSADILSLENCPGDIAERLVIHNNRRPISDGWVYGRELRGVRSSVPQNSPFLRGLQIFMGEISAEEVLRAMEGETVWKQSHLLDRRLYQSWPF